MMRIWPANLAPRLNASVDWFIPAQLKQSRDLLQAIRVFVFSHLFGPFLGHTISLSMLYLGAEADLSWWILFISISAFWVYPIVLRLTGWYTPLALISIQNLMFCIFWGCYQYGGISSPIMPWLVTVPLLGFFYLPERATRITVSALIVANLALFYGVYTAIGFRESVAPHALVVLGLFSYQRLQIDHFSLQGAGGRNGGELTATGLTLRLERNVSRTIAWSELVEVAARRLPPDPPYEKMSFVDLVTASGPVRLLPSSRLDYAALPGGMAPNTRENWRRLVALARERNPAIAIEAESAEFFAGGRDAPMFPAWKKFLEWDRRYD